MNENVSVIIIAKDEPLIYYTLKSLELQETKPYEIIVVIDTPNDLSAMVAKEFVDKLPIKIVINDVKPGYGGARRKGVEVAKGSIIAFIDADVIVPPWWLSRIIKNLKESLVTSGPAIPIKESEIDTLVRNISRFSYCEYIYIKFAPTQNFAFKKDILKIVGNFDEKFDVGGEDYDFCVRLRIAYINILYDSCNFVLHIIKHNHIHKLKKAWRDGRARARVFIKHKIYVLKDTLTALMHSLTLLTLPLVILYFLIYLNPILFIPFAMSLAHRLYRAILIRKNEQIKLLHAIGDSLLTYVSYIAFVIEVFKSLPSLVYPR